MAKPVLFQRLMSLFSRSAIAADAEDGATADHVLAALPSPTTAKLREAFGINVDADEDQWRPLSGDSDRDLTPMTRDRMRDLAVYLWQSNLVGNRMVELPIAYLLAEGVQLVAKNEDAQGYLDAFWHDPINRMDLKLPKKVRELYLFGEQCWPVFVNEFSGRVRLGNLDPSLIEKVVVDPDNPEQPIGIITKRDKKTGNRRKYRVIVPGPEADCFTARTQQIRATFEDGECFYYAINELTSVVRGHSALLGHIDWLDAYEQFMFGEIDRSHILRAFLWDVTIKGATPEEVKKRAGEITAPKPNSVRVHNDSEEWNTVAPTLNAAENAEAARLFRNHLLGGRTIPEHWYGGGGDVNRATGESMSEPTFKTLSMDQWIWRQILQDVGRFVISRALDPTGGSWIDADDEELMPKAIFPELTARDVSTAATALNQVVAAAGSAIDRGVWTEKTALLVINAVAGRLGVEIDAEEELKAAREEAAKRREEDSFQDPPDDEGLPDPDDKAAA